MFKLVNKLSLILAGLMLVTSMLFYFTIGETKPTFLIDTVSATVMNIDTLKTTLTDTNLVKKDSVVVKDSVIIKDSTIAWKSEWGKQTGEASWYGLGDGYNGKKTASGVIFDTYSNQCAHLKFKFGTILKVENLSNNKSTIVKVMDRGPYSHGRIIDLSYKSKTELGMGGTTKVKLTVISIPENKEKVDKVKKEKVKKETKVKKKSTKKVKKPKNLKVVSL